MWHCGFVCKEANKVQFKDEINQGSVREREAQEKRLGGCCHCSREESASVNISIEGGEESPDLVTVSE